MLLRDMTVGSEDTYDDHMGQDRDENLWYNNVLKETHKACRWQVQKDGDSGMTGGGDLQMNSRF